MKFTMESKCIVIEPESAQDQAYLRELGCLPKKRGAWSVYSTKGHFGVNPQRDDIDKVWVSLSKVIDDAALEIHEAEKAKRELEEQQ